MCVQMLKAWGAHVTVTCSRNAERFIRGLGADCVVDYTAGPVKEPLSALDKWDSPQSFICDGIIGACVCTDHPYFSGRQDPPAAVCSLNLSFAQTWVCLLHPMSPLKFFCVSCFHQPPCFSPQDLTWSWTTLGATQRAGHWICLSLGVELSTSPLSHHFSRTLIGWASLTAWCRLLPRWPAKPSR